VGAPADLCLMPWPLANVLDTLASEQVAAAIVGGNIVHS
jgi:hypothetical protein